MENAMFEGLKPNVPGFFRLDSDSKESWDDWLDSFKDGILYLFDSIDSIFISIRLILRLVVVLDRPGRVPFTKIS